MISNVCSLYTDGKMYMVGRIPCFYRGLPFVCFIFTHLARVLSTILLKMLQRITSFHSTGLHATIFKSGEIHDSKQPTAQLQKEWSVVDFRRSVTESVAWQHNLRRSMHFSFNKSPLKYPLQPLKKFRVC